MKRDIRFLVTYACNYDCFFCHREGMTEAHSSVCKQELTIEDYTNLFLVYSKMEDWNGVTLSGGEPLIYRNIVGLCKSLSENGAEITIVTNGFYLLDKKEAIQYVKQINVSLHTLDSNIYSKTVGRESEALTQVLRNIREIRKMYPDLIIRINVTPTKLNWTVDMMKKMIEFANEINASIKYTEQFPNTEAECIPLVKIKEEMFKLGYQRVHTKTRTECYAAPDMPDIHLTQCTCSKAMLCPIPVHYCQETHDLYVTHNGQMTLCRMNPSHYLSIFDELMYEDYEMLRYKIKVAMNRISSTECNAILKNI